MYFATNSVTEALFHYVITFTARRCGDLGPRTTTVYWILRPVVASENFGQKIGRKIYS